MDCGGMAGVRPVAACLNRSKLSDFLKEVPDLMAPPVHLSVVIPRHRTVPPRWNRRRLPDKPVGMKEPVPSQSPEPEILKQIRHADELRARTRWRARRPGAFATASILLTDPSRERPTPCFWVPLLRRTP